MDFMNAANEQGAINAVSRVLNEAGIHYELSLEPHEQRSADAEFQLLPDHGRLLVEYKSALAVRQFSQLLGHLRQIGGPKVKVGICVRRMSWALLDACKEAGVALFDLEGNAYLRMPGIYIERLRPTAQGFPEPTSGTVFTAKAARIVRAFLHRHPEGWGQVELVRATGLSAGYVSRLVKRLVAQGYATDRAGRIQLDDPDRLLDDWVSHYRFDRHRKLSYAISTSHYEDGMSKLGEGLKGAVSNFAWTGWSGAQIRAPYATPVQYSAYISEVPKGMKGIYPVETQGNVALYLPQDAGVFQFTTPSETGDCVSDAQLYLDLSRMPGRAKEQADALRQHRLDFMRRSK